MQNDFIENLNEYNDINLLKSKHVLIYKTDRDNISSFSDTVLIENDQYVLYRKIRFYHSFNNSNYKIEILQSQAQTDLLIWRIVILNVALAMSFFLIIFFLNHLSVKRGLRIFYKTLRKLENYNIGKPELIFFENSEIDELNKLTDIFKKMTLKISNDYKEQKEYTENVSHEIQTPLAIISAKADTLLQSENLKKTELEQLEIIMNTTTRLAKINQALILLTKIDNKFYTNEESIPLLKLINEKLNFFKDLLSEKKIEVQLDIDSSYNLQMHSYLADTLFLNLIKNAIMHNIVNGEIIIKLDSTILLIINTGQKLNITGDIFKRFIRSENKDSLGIGLSIVKKICGYYSIPISYNFNKNHEFTLILEDGK